MITRRNSIGDRYVYDDDDNLVAVHGKFCTGCSATSGVCGRLTEKMLPIYNRLSKAGSLAGFGYMNVHDNYSQLG
jgi:hypothetical protein